MKRLALAISLFLFATPFTHGQNKNLTFSNAVESISAKIEPADAKPGQLVNLTLTVSLKPGWYTYPNFQPDQREKDSQTKISLPEGTDLIFVEQVRDPVNFKTKQGPAGSLAYYVDKAIWNFPAIISPKAIPGEKNIAFKLFKIIVCNEITENCLPPKTVPVETKLNVSSGSVAIDDKYLSIVNKALGINDTSNPPSPKADPKTPAKSEIKTPNDDETNKKIARRVLANVDQQGELNEVLQQLPDTQLNNTGFLSFILTAMFWGIMTLLTPCVFPMVPITVSVFLKQSEKQHTNPLISALIYAGTIVLVLGVASVLLLKTFRALSVDPYMNIALGLLFVVFAFSLFGMFDIALPGWLVDMSASREGKGGYLGTIFMAISFTIVSFTCVAPFLGGFSGMAASGKFSDFQLFCGGFAFAIAFASPFFLLALFPNFLKKLPKSGGWMNTIKVTMGFLELAAALKFFRTAELRLIPIPTVFTYDLVLSIWVISLIAMGLYLFGFYRLPHDHEKHEHIGVPRLIMAVGVIAIALYLSPALFSKGGGEKNRPAGILYAWVDSFLLPEPSAAEFTAGSELTWSGDLKRTLDDARSREGYIFIDFTGVTCTNCKLNEKNVFSKPEMKELLKKYSLVQLYTDDVPEVFYETSPDDSKRSRDAKANLNFQLDAFKTEQLPLYVILKPEPGNKTKIVGIYDEGKINDERAFAEFLKKPFAK